jgi:hypothetical protein
MKRFSEFSDDQQDEIVAARVDDQKWWEPIEEGFIEDLTGLGFKDIDIQFTGFWSQGDGASFTARLNFKEFWSKMKDEIGFQSESFDAGWEELDKLSKTDDGKELIELGFAALYRRPSLPILIEHEFFLGQVERDSHRYVHERSTSFSFDNERYSVVDDPEEIDATAFDISREDEDELLRFCEHIEVWMEKWLINKNLEIYRALEKRYDEACEEEKEYLLEEDEEVEETFPY